MQHLRFPLKYKMVKKLIDKLVCFYSDDECWRISFALLAGGMGFFAAQQSEKFISSGSMEVAAWIVMALATAAIWYVVKFHGVTHKELVANLDMDWLIQKWPGTDFDKTAADAVWATSGKKCCTCGHRIIQGNANSFMEGVKNFFGARKRTTTS